MFNVLDQLNIEFKRQLSKITLKWCDKYKYDFYIKKENCIIEIHGLQHYENATRGRTLKEEQKNDEYKTQLALSNGIKYYISINCRISDLDFIKNNIMQSELPNIFDFKEEDINWLKCHEYAISSTVKTVCDLWNNENDLLKISNELKINKATVRQYLKQGVKLKWCNYNPEKELIKNYKRDKFGKNNPNYGKHHSEKVKQKMRLARKGKYFGENHPNAKQIICLTTGKIFSYMKQAAKYYNVSYKGLSSCCRGKNKSAGKHPKTGEKLKWMYYKDYIKDNINNTVNKGVITSII
jgi:hypothetical protein